MKLRDKQKRKMRPAALRAYIDSVQGRFKSKPGEKSVVQELVEERRAEKAKEDRDFNGAAAPVKHKRPASSLPAPNPSRSKRKSKSTG
jgi:hypothetical protein